MLDFLIVAFVLFLVVRALKKAQERFTAAPPPPDATTRPCPRCLEVIPKKATRCRACTSEMEAIAP